MTIEQQILRDLSAGRSTASSIGLRLKVSEEAITVILKRLEATRHVASKPLITGPRPLLVYQLASP
jgi:predicted ArsR family transcriptional regulator